MGYSPRVCPKIKHIFKAKCIKDDLMFCGYNKNYIERSDIGLKKVLDKEKMAGLKIRK